MSTVLDDLSKRNTLDSHGEMVRREFAFEIDTRASNLSERRFSGYITAYGVKIPSYNEIVDQGSATRTIAERGDRVKCLWMHDAYNPIGKPKVLSEDSTGVYAETQLADTRTVREEYMPLLLEGVVDRMSIGFTPSKVLPWDESPDELNHLQEFNLLEYSPVTFPANEGAVISNVRAVLGQARRAMGLTSEKPLSADDAKYAMAVLMGARGAGSFSDLPLEERQGIYDRLAAEYARHGLTPPPFDVRRSVYLEVQFAHGEAHVYSARSLRKRLSDVTSTAKHAARLGIPIDSELVAEAEAALDAIQALGLDGVQGRMDRIAQARDLTKRLGITIS